MSPNQQQRENITSLLQKRKAIWLTNTTFRVFKNAFDYTNASILIYGQRAYIKQYLGTNVKFWPIKERKCIPKIIEK